MSGRRDFTVERPVNLLTSSKMNNPMRDNMVLDKEIHLNFNPR